MGNILLFPMFLLQNKRITQMKTCQWFLLSQDIQPLQGITHTLVLVMVDIPMLVLLDILTLVMVLCLLMELELIMKKTENICWTISQFLEENTKQPLLFFKNFLYFCTFRFGFLLIKLKA